MKKYRSRVGQRIYPVEYSSMTGNTVPHVLNSFISLDGGDDYVSRESGNRNESTYQDNVGSGEGSQETEEVTNDGSTDYTARNPSHVLFGLTFGSILCRPRSLPQINCITSLISVRNTRNNSRPRPPALNPGSSGSDRR